MSYILFLVDFKLYYYNCVRINRMEIPYILTFMKLFLFFVFKKTLIVYLMFNVQCLLPCAIYSQTTKNTFSNLKFIRRENIFFFIVSYIFILHTNGDIVSTFTHNCLKMRSISLFTSLHTFGGLWEGGIFRISPLYKTVLICKIALTYNFFPKGVKVIQNSFSL